MALIIGNRLATRAAHAGTRPWFGQSLYLGGAHKLFDSSGTLIDEDSRKRVQGYVQGFAAFVGGKG
jgi:hypothetical protein